MNVGINALSSLQGGGKHYLVNLLHYVNEFPEIRVYVFSPPQYVNVYSLPGVEVIACKTPSKSIVHRSLWERWKFPRLLKKLNIDLLFCPGGIINLSPPPDCLTAVTFQNMLIFDTLERKRYALSYMRFRLALLERISRKSIKKANVVIFLTQYAKQVIDRRLLKRKGSSVIIPHGLDNAFRTANSNDLPRLQSLPADEYLLYVSVVCVYKAHIQVVQAYHMLCQMRETKEKLLFVGPVYAPYEKLVRKEINRLNLHDKVFIAGPFPYADMPMVYHHAKAHIFASSCENCPNVVLEMLGSGRPLFLSNRPPMPEIAGDAAVYFDPYEPAQLADLLLRFLDDEQWMRKMGSNAFERSFGYSWENTARKTFRTFNRLHNYFKRADQCVVSVDFREHSRMA